ncbi:efflux RND transporter permease subunit [Iodidimonas sp. SYSU 1G8]|uniref:efflux RND transporter permease subunit n=1 Tax=Iodidimonas sp. SYSU 1G8 TaxID=3133967 RepID=UPI0031FEFADB
MRFTDLFIRRPVLSIVVSLSILLAGVSAFLSLPLREYPNLESATIVVDTSYPGANQTVMQGFVTTPIAQAIATANGIDYLTSVSSAGRSQVKAKLVLNADADRAMTEVLAKVQQVSYRLPEGANDPVITKVTDGASAIQYIAFVSETLPVPRITDFASRVAQPMLTAIPGVASAEISGGQTLAIRVWLDPARMAARGLSAGDVAGALRANNVQAAPGTLKGQDSVVNISAATDVTDVSQFGDMVIKTSADGLVHLRDVATVEIGGQNYDASAFTDGKRSITISVQPTPDGNPLDIVREAKARIADMQRVAPPGLTVVNQFDVAHFVNAAIDEVIWTLVEAVFIVIVVIFLFMGSLRAVLIPVVTIPLSLVGTAALMLALGLSINLLTLLAMVLAIGLVVDDAIVVVENIHRHIEEGMKPFDAALVGAREIVSPVIAMTITLAAVYAPIGLMGGLTGALFREFAFTLAGAVIVSGIIALTLSPMMSARLLSSATGEGRLARKVEHTMSSLTRSYERLLGHTLAAPAAVLLVGIAVLPAIVVFFQGAQRELAPGEDQGYVFTQIKAPQYAGIGYTERYSKQVETLFRSLPEYTGSWFDNGTDGVNNGFGGVILSEWQDRERSADDVQAELNTRAASIDGVFTAAFQPAALPASTGGLPVQMALRSTEDFHAIHAAMERIKGEAWKSGLFAFVDSDLAFDSPEARIEIDRAKAAEMGVSMDEIAQTLAVLVGENYINRFNYFDRSYDVITQVPQADRVTPDRLGHYYVRTGSGELAPLSTVTRIEMRPQANRLPQFNQMNSATLSGVLAPGVTMGQAVDFLKAQELPRGSSIDWMGDARQYVEEGNRLTVSFLFALVVIFLVLAAQFESFRDPLVILVTVPLAVCGALAPLYLGFVTLNIYTQIGLVTLIGLISKHGILMVTFANELQAREGLGRLEAIQRAAAVRMRPVLMTTAAMVAGLLPLLSAAGAGESSRFAIGLVVVTGMLVGTLFTLFVLPTAYSLIARDHRPKPSEAPPVTAVTP